MPKTIKTTFLLICLSFIAVLTIAVLSGADIIQAAILLSVNGFIFMALFTIKFYNKSDDNLSSETNGIFSEHNIDNIDNIDNQQLLDELAQAKKIIQEYQLQNQKSGTTTNINTIQSVPPGYVHQSVLPNYEISFTPQGSPNTLMSKFIKSAKKELYIAQYDLYENRALIEEIISAKRKNIDVRFLIDYEKNSSIQTIEILKYLESFNIPVYRSTNYETMRHQFIIADGTAIQLGNGFGINKKSANSILVFQNAKNMVDIYRNEFLRLAHEPQNQSVICNDVGCPADGIITWKQCQLGYRWQCSKYDSQNSLCQICELLGDDEHLERQQKGKVVNVEQIGCDHQGEVITWINKWSNQAIGESNQFWICSGHNKNDELCQRCTIKGNEDKPERSLQARAGDKCPLCKNGVLKMRRDSYGKYVLGCGNYPACKYPETNE